MKSPRQKRSRKHLKAPQRPPHHKTLHFLIVENEPAHAELIRRGLLAFPLPYRLTIEDTLSGARKILENDPADLVILDNRLPDGSGEDLLPENPDELRFPVLFMTGYGEEADAERLVWRGAVDYITKGKAAFDDLAHTTERALRIWKNRQSERVLLHQLSTKESVLHALLSNPADSIALLDRRGTILDLNPTLAKRMGMTIPEILGTCVYDHLPVDLAASRRGSIEKVFDTGVVERFEDEHGGCWYDNILQPVPDENGRVRQVLVIARDITERKQADKALRESEALYRTLIEELPDFVIVHRQGRLLYINAALARSLGKQAFEVIHSDIMDYVAPESREIVLKALRKRAGNAALPPYVAKIFLPAGEERWVEIRGAGIVFEGQPASLNVLTDITEKKWALDALFASEQKFRTLADYTFDWEYWMGPDGKYVYVSPSCERITGYPPDEFYRNKDFLNDLVVPEDREMFREYYDKSVDSPNPGSLEFRIRTKGGSIAWIGHICYPIHNPEGEYLGRRGSNRDITQRKAAEEALRKSETRFRSLIQNASDMIRILDREGRIVYESPSTERILGYPEGTLIGKEPWPYIHPDDIERVRSEFGTIFDRTNDGIPTEFRVRRADGTYIWVDSIGANLLGVEGIDGIVVTTRPIGQRKYMEQALLESQARVRESEEFLRQVINGAGEGIIGYDRSLHISLWNRFMEELTGYPTGEVLGKDVFEIFPFLKKEGIDALLFDALEGKSNQSIDVPFVFDRTGKKGWGQGIYSPIHDANGAIVGAMGIVRDITDVRKAQRALRESEEKYRLFTETSPDMIYFIDPGGHIRFVNRRAAEGLMMRPEDIIGKHLNDIFPPDTARNHLIGIRHIVETRKPSETELIENLPSGNLWIEARLSPLFDAENNVLGVLGISHDITDRKRAQIALEESGERYRSLFSQSPVGITLTDIAGNILEINETMLGMFGYTRDEIGSTNISSFYADPEIRLQLAGTVLAKGSVSDHELMCRRHDGSTFPVLLNSARITRGGERLFQSTFIDITDRKMMEEEIRSLNRALEQRVVQRTDQLNASLEEKEILLREIHHRVKNNLQIIISILRLQNRHITDPGTQAILLDSESRVRSMALVHEKLYRSIDLAHIDIGDYLRDLSRYLFNTYSVSQGHVTFSVKISDISLDINRAIPLGLILNELLSNALKHAFPPQSGGEIAITGSQTEDTITLSVQDNGAGMPDGFDWRHSASLGMHLVVTLIEQVHGTIEKEEHGRGTCFVLKIPRNAGT